MKKGKLIVLDGIDGSGKATQTTLLAKNLKEHGYPIKIEDFPQYGKKSSGLVEEYLRGKYGSAQEIGPYIPSIFYASDRFAASKRIRTNLGNGFIVVSNRYTTANLGHQGSKLRSKIARKKYFNWLFDLEYGFFRIPKPDLVIILDMPVKIARKLVGHRGRRQDIHEVNRAHLEISRKIFLEVARELHYPVVECYDQDRILTPKEISEKVWAIVSKNLRMR